MCIGVNAFFSNIPITHMKTIVIFHTDKPCCWSLLLSTESITCPQIHVLISNPVIQQSTSNQTMIVGCAFDSSLSISRGQKPEVNLFSAFLVFALVDLIFHLGMHEAS